MTKKRTNKSQYPSRYSPGGWVSAPQYITELICEKKAQKDQKELPKQLTDAEKYCIQGMHYNKMSAQDISKTLGREAEEVETYVESLEQEEDRTFIINETGTGNKGVAIMTQAGSERIDAARERHVAPRNNANTIHSIHD